MANNALPNPNARRANAPTVAWTTLPESNDAEIPAVPGGLMLNSAAQAWWDHVWSTGVSTMWRRDEHPLIARRALIEAQIAADFAGEDGLTAALLSEARRTDDALGLSPEGRKAKRWRYPGEFGAATATDNDDTGTTTDSGVPDGVIDLGERAKSRRGA